MLFRMETRTVSPTLGEHIGELIGCRHSLDMKVSVLCRFVCEELPNVDVICSLSATNHIIGPLDAYYAVFIHRRWRFRFEVPMSLSSS